MPRFFKFMMLILVPTCLYGEMFFPTIKTLSGLFAPAIEGKPYSSNFCSPTWGAIVFNSEVPKNIVIYNNDEEPITHFAKQLFHVEDEIGLFDATTLPITIATYLSQENIGEIIGIIIATIDDINQNYINKQRLSLAHFLRGTVTQENIQAMSNSQLIEACKALNLEEKRKEVFEKVEQQLTSVPMLLDNFYAVFPSKRSFLQKALEKIIHELFSNPENQRKARDYAAITQNKAVSTIQRLSDELSRLAPDSLPKMKLDQKRARIESLRSKLPETTPESTFRVFQQSKDKFVSTLIGAIEQKNGCPILPALLLHGFNWRKMQPDGIVPFLYGLYKQLPASKMFNSHVASEIEKQEKKGQKLPYDQFFATVHQFVQLQTFTRRDCEALGEKTEEQIKNETMYNLELLALAFGGAKFFNSLPRPIRFHSNTTYEGIVFIDCNEIITLNIIFSILYQPLTQSVNLALLEQLNASQALKDFFKKYKTAQQMYNVQVHNDWAAIVSRIPGVKYAAPEKNPIKFCEIDSMRNEEGIKNFERVLHHIFPSINTFEELAQQLQSVGISTTVEKTINTQPEINHDRITISLQKDDNPPSTMSIILRNGHSDLETNTVQLSTNWYKYNSALNSSIPTNYYEQTIKEFFSYGFENNAFLEAFKNPDLIEFFATNNWKQEDQIRLQQKLYSHGHKFYDEHERLRKTDFFSLDFLQNRLDQNDYKQGIDWVLNRQDTPTEKPEEFFGYYEWIAQVLPFCTNFSPYFFKDLERKLEGLPPKIKESFRESFIKTLKKASIYPPLRISITKLLLTLIPQPELTYPALAELLTSPQEDPTIKTSIIEGIIESLQQLPRDTHFEILLKVTQQALQENAEKDWTTSLQLAGEILRKLGPLGAELRKTSEWKKLLRVA
jgi:hypothetical protein